MREQYLKENGKTETPNGAKAYSRMTETNMPSIRVSS